VGVVGSLIADRIPKLAKILIPQKKPLAPQLRIEFNHFFDDPRFAVHKYPLYEYSFDIRNVGGESVEVRDLLLVLSFRYRIAQTSIRTAPGKMGNVLWMRMINGEGGQPRVVEDQFPDAGRTGLPSLVVRTRTSDGEQVNTNEAVLTCAKWPKDAFCVAQIVVDTCDVPEFLFLPDSMGTFRGTYVYEIEGREYTERIEGQIPDPNMKRRLAQYHFERGLDCEKRGRVSEAIVEYDKAVQSDSGYADAYCNRGRANASLKQYRQASEDYAMFSRLRPDDPDGYFGQGLACAWAEDYGGATEGFDQAIRLKPDHAQAYLNRGTVFSRPAVHRYDAAIADCGKALEIDPTLREQVKEVLADAYHNRGVEYAESGDHTSAIADFSITLQLRPFWGTTLFMRGLCHKARGDDEKALDDFRAASTLGILRARKECESMLRESGKDWPWEYGFADGGEDAGANRELGIIRLMPIGELRRE